MVKLLWNTHNQTTPIPQNLNKTDDRNYLWGIYHKTNSNEWINYILKKIEFKIIKDIEELKNEEILIIVDSSIEKKKDLYTKLRLICSKIFLIHLGDEACSFDLTSIYNNCDYVWRTFCSNRYFNNNKITCLPLGYKSGVKLESLEAKRKYKWAFIGTPHKSSRHDLLFQFSSINPSYSYKTEKFNEKIIEVKEMSEILSSTTFIPCPNGFVHPETYRLYEALECGCIPIVENSYKYYDRLFPANPFIKIYKWIDAKLIISKWSDEQIKTKQDECNVWWKDYKLQLQESIKSKVQKK